MLTLFLIIFIYGVILFINNYWHKYILDKQRFELYRLRDELRDYFEINNLDTSMPVYRNTRIMINNYVKYLKRAKIKHFMFTLEYFKQHPDYSEYRKLQHDRQFNTPENEKLNEFIKSIRIKSSDLVIEYAYSQNIYVTLLYTLLNWISKNHYQYTIINDKKIKTITIEASSSLSFA